MNSVRRYVLTAVIERMEVAVAEVEAVHSEEQDACDNINERFPDSDQAALLEASASALEEAVASLEAAIESLREAVQ